MQQKFLVSLAVACFISATNALAAFNMSAPLGMEWFSNNTNFTNAWYRDRNFNITKVFLAGFSSGSMLSTNIMTLHPESFDGFGFLSGMPMKTFQVGGEPEMYDENYQRDPNLRGKQVFMTLGSLDNAFTKEQLDASLRFFEKQGGNVTQQYLHDFNHVMGANLPENKEWNPYKTCAITPEGMKALIPPKKSCFANCGYNMAYYLLQTLDPNNTLQEKANNHTEYGTFHAFNQTPFTNGNKEAKMGEIGYIYIPETCKNGAYCKLVMFLHGCQQAAGWWKDTEARRTGLLEYAATNNLIVVFPQNDDAMYLDMGPDKEPFEFKYCWSSMQATEIANPQITTLFNIMNSLVLGANGGQDLAESDVQQAALLQKEQNNNLQYIDEVMQLSDYVLQI